MKRLDRRDFCCDVLYNHLVGPDGDGCEINFIYFPDTRDYAIPYKARRGGGHQLIHFCPWCGSNLPETLGSKMMEILRCEYGIKTYERKDLPKEFRTDEWWKKRGL